MPAARQHHMQEKQRPPHLNPLPLSISSPLPSRSALLHLCDLACIYCSGAGAGPAVPGRVLPGVAALQPLRVSVCRSVRQCVSVSMCLPVCLCVCLSVGSTAGDQRKALTTSFH